MKAVVMAGGFGTRLRPLTEKLPKPMAYVANLPMMEHVVRLLVRAGIPDLDVLLYFYPKRSPPISGTASPGAPGFTTSARSPITGRRERSRTPSPGSTTRSW